ncbi:EAL domain-containing protein [Pseudomaricurvus alcaniphilus]|nr:EAL domain-containing protein [Pseudomaricurvus alcaniphilus]
MDDAIEHQHFSMVYQPLFSMQTSRLLGFEALVRCQSPQFGFISPEDFIPHAEKSGRIVPLGDWIFQTSLLDLKRFHQYGFHNISMSLNVSPVQIVESNIFERVMSLISRLDIPPNRVKLELTETALIKNPQTVSRVFDVFQQEGVQIWVDDFGTGFASLSLLRKFKVDGLKIDRSFVDGISESNDDFTLCSAIIAMAQRLGLHIVAEGIEDDTQLQILNQLGCEIGQGYLLGKPESFERNLQLWSQNQRTNNEL